MKFNISLVFLMFWMLHVVGQNPVSWQFSFEEKGDQVVITALADIRSGWAIYGQEIGDDGPIPTRFFIEGLPIVFSEKSKGKKELDPIFEIEIKKFKKQAVFTHTISKGSTKKLEGFVTFMSCDDEKCLPPVDVPFKYSW
ncbi:MAG: hypothetical protein IPN79_17890 [Saprospiraceae bacterium]|nr:hypothetical protein [Saprospiraceae bacterium]